MFNEIKESIKKQKKNLPFLTIAGIMVGILIIFMGKYFSSETLDVYSKDQESIKGVGMTSAEEEYKEKIEKQLEDILSKIDGIGKVDAMVYIKSGEEKVPVYNENTSANVTEETDSSGGKRTTNQNNTGSSVVVGNDGSSSEPFIKRVDAPDITGIVIVAEGVDDEYKRTTLVKTVCNLFDIPSSKVNIHLMKEN